MKNPDFHSSTLVFETFVDPVFMVGEDRTLLSANSAARNLIPFTRVDQPVTLTLRSPDILRCIDHVISTGDMQRLEWHDTVPIDRFFDIRMTPLTLERRGTVVVVILREITDIRNAERMRADFIANVSHELRTPLASVAGFIETLQGAAQHDEKARQKFLSIMHDQAQRMSRLIDDLLSLSRIEQKAHVRPKDPVDLLQVIRHVVDGFNMIAQRNGSQINIHTPEKLIVPGDRDELIRLIENLVGNGLKYGALPDQPARVDVRVEQSGQEALLTVQDFGPGIAPEHLPRLTERFYRVDAVASRARGGTGLGLALVKHITTRHRGRLEISSTLGEGSCFKIRLPLQA